MDLEQLREELKQELKQELKDVDDKLAAELIMAARKPWFVDEEHQKRLDPDG